MTLHGGSEVDETIGRYPTTGPIFLQQHPLYVASRPPGMTLDEYATLSGVAIAPLLELLNAAAEAEDFAPRFGARPDDRQSVWRRRASPGGSIGYTGSYHEASRDIVDVSVVSVLDARGPE